MSNLYSNNLIKHDNTFMDKEFNKKLSSLKKYCPQSYKYLIFQFRHYNFFQDKDGVYEFNLPTSSEFKYIYGQIKLKYCVKDKNIIFKDLEPSQFFMDGYMIDLDAYKGIYYRNNRDKFMIDLFFTLRKKRKDCFV